MKELLKNIRLSLTPEVKLKLWLYLIIVFYIIQSFYTLIGLLTSLENYGLAQQLGVDFYIGVPRQIAMFLVLYAIVKRRYWVVKVLYIELLIIILSYPAMFLWGESFLIVILIIPVILSVVLQLLIIRFFKKKVVKEYWGFKVEEEVGP